MLLLRIAKRRSSWEPGVDVDETLRVEFRTRQGSLDLRPSVYEIEDTENTVVKAYAEHAAGAGLNPPRGAANMNLRHVAQTIEATPGSSSFRFTRAAHRELIFSNETELRDFVRHVYGELEDRRRKTTYEQLKEFVRARLGADDPEWTQHCIRHQQWSKLAK